MKSKFFCRVESRRGALGFLATAERLAPGMSCRVKSRLGRWDSWPQLTGRSQVMSCRVKSWLGAMGSWPQLTGRPHVWAVGLRAGLGWWDSWPQLTYRPKVWVVGLRAGLGRWDSWPQLTDRPQVWVVASRASVGRYRVPGHSWPIGLRYKFYRCFKNCSDPCIQKPTLSQSEHSYASEYVWFLRQIFVHKGRTYRYRCICSSSDRRGVVNEEIQIILVRRKEARNRCKLV